MFDSFSWRHITPLLFATPMLFGGLFHGLLRPKEALLTYGMKPQIANSRDAQIVYYGHTMRTSAFGLLIYVFYLQNKLAAVDTTMVVMSAYAGMADVFIIWKYGNRDIVPWRLAAALIIAGWGAFGMTSGGAS